MRSCVRRLVSRCPWALCYCYVHIGHQTEHLDFLPIKTQINRQMEYVKEKKYMHITAIALARHCNIAYGWFTNNPEAGYRCRRLVGVLTHLGAVPFVINCYLTWLLGSALGSWRVLEVISRSTLKITESEDGNRSSFFRSFFLFLRYNGLERNTMHVSMEGTQKCGRRKKREKNEFLHLF